MSEDKAIWPARKTNWFNKDRTEEKLPPEMGFSMRDARKLPEIEEQVKAQGKSHGHIIFTGFADSDTRAYLFCSECRGEVAITYNGEDTFYFSSNFFNEKCPGKPEPPTLPMDLANSKLFAV